MNSIGKNAAANAFFKLFLLLIADTIIAITVLKPKNIT